MTPPHGMCMVKLYTEPQGIILNNIRTREAGIITVDTPDGEVTGISYQCDFRAEEEYGSSALTDAWTASANEDSFFLAQARKTPDFTESRYTQADLLVLGEDFVAFQAPGRFSSPLDQGEITRALAYIKEQTPYTRFETSLFSIERQTVSELRATLAKRGVKAPSKARKADLVNAVMRSMVVGRENIHPAWFHMGSALILPRGTGDEFGDMVERLIDAAEAGFLAVGSAGVRAFGSGLTLFDERDLGPKTRDQVSKQNDWYNEQMTPITQVKAELRDEGYSVYHIGNPRTDESGQTVYFVNASAPKSKQFFGWHSLAQLKARDFDLSA